MDPANLREVIAWRRERLGKSQNQLGGESGVGQATISRLEHGNVDVRVGTLREIARALEMDVRVVPREVLYLVDEYIRSVMVPEGGSRERLPLYSLEVDGDVGA